MPQVRNSGEDDDECSEWRRAKYIVYRTHPYFLKFDLKEDQVSDNDVTFVAQVGLLPKITKAKQILITG